MDLGRRWIASVALLAAAGCASAPKPVDTLARSEAAVRSAQVMGAEQNPTAALHLRLAQEQLQLARRKMNDGDNERARYLLLRAQADADLAMNLAQEARAQDDAARTMQQVQSMQTQTGRGP